ncbi:transcriptional regulator [Candidozyma auris]|uniref:NOT2/NOT3/NOT5 C-terminal domain-containing protein n=1 Tax=Candidozyma auris TaxID=498019 RepID=A0A2H0ZQM1_CANAR|nr:CCR4-NOT core subunit CDC36 [[Candida] auris]PIS51020.1 hypothetical protein B9J08_002590 [[Candida] auris]PIS52987.1 hypothetical protein CJI97_002644 [[Candida] auris]PSK76658.1 hypothetical protein CJJ07_003551 [[Candida] auris]QEL59425.1 hypothetical protein CJJ09_001502 [[Candida] auris]QEO19658.1 hypothetical_protein [[Candida] auris]
MSTNSPKPMSTSTSRAAGLPPGLQPSRSTNQTPVNNGEASNGAPAADIDSFGLKGIASLLRMDQTEKNSFAYGQDVQLLGLDLSDNSSILKNMASPWQETSRTEVEPYFSLPESIQQSKIVPPPEPCDTKISSFADETLFYIFYTKPRDTLQEYAARELVARNWRYHRDIQVWLTKDSNVEPVLISPDVERGVYIFFDPHNWEKIRKEFVLHYSSVQA